MASKPPDDFARDFAALFEDDEAVPFFMSKPGAWMVFCALQLALRHPEFPETIRPAVEGTARWLQDQVATTPALARVAEQGWHQAFDVPRVPHIHVARRISEAVSNGS